MIKIFEIVDYNIEGFATAKKVRYYVRKSYIESFEVVASEYNSEETTVHINMRSGRVIDALFRTTEDLNGFLLAMQNVIQE